VDKLRRKASANFFVGWEVIRQDFEIWAQLLSGFHPHPILDTKLSCRIVATCDFGPDPPPWATTAGLSTYWGNFSARLLQRSYRNLHGEYICGCQVRFGRAF
jgi:hypothetical protein